ncbi:unnamed protein product [Cladocopium goreaui]|uniref:Pentatricopeptide repeat-containing protein, chloroplastic n=1 Tax=Cladocopium goreaui TaxID=2562237 RepID=A0A9P1CVX5_9DINO|nr:unnamed protein product [Cladocopium goreaui]
MASATAVLRSLLRLAHRAQRCPAELVPLLGSAPKVWNWEEKRVVVPPQRPFIWCDELLRSCANATEYSLPVADRRSLRAVRKHWHLCHSLGVPYVPQAQEALERWRKAAAMAEKLRQSDHRHELSEAQVMAARWRLTWCAPSEDHQAEVGDVLMTHPLSGLFQEVYDQAVLLVVESNQEEGLVKALILNKDSGETLAQRKTLPRGSVKLVNEPVYQGGPVDVAELWWLHSASTDELLREGATSLRLGLAMGGELQRISSSSVRFFKGCAAWATEQLQTELQRGVWVHARPGFHRGGREALHQLALEARGASAWRAALLATNLPALAEFPRGHDVDTMLQEYVTTHQRKMAMELLQKDGQFRQCAYTAAFVPVSGSKVIFQAPEGDSISAAAQIFVGDSLARRAMTRRAMNVESAGQRPIGNEEFRSEWQRAAEAAPSKVSKHAALAALADAPDLVVQEAWDSSTFRTSAPGGDLYTQWHRLFAHGTLGDGRGAVELHWKEEDGYGYKVLWLRGWQGSTVPTTFSTSKVARALFRWGSLVPSQMVMAVMGQAIKEFFFLIIWEIWEPIANSLFQV